MAVAIALYYCTHVRPRLERKRKRAQRRGHNDEEFSEGDNSSEDEESSEDEDSSEDEESSEYEDSSEDEESFSCEDGDETTSKYSLPIIGSANDDAMQANVMGAKNAIETNGVDAKNEPSKKCIRLSVPCPTVKQS